MFSEGGRDLQIAQDTPNILIVVAIMDDAIRSYSGEVNNGYASVLSSSQIRKSSPIILLRTSLKKGSMFGGINS